MDPRTLREPSDDPGKSLEGPAQSALEVRPTPGWGDGLAAVPRLFLPVTERTSLEQPKRTST
jgi:hypothetical protein